MENQKRRLVLALLGYIVQKNKSAHQLCDLCGIDWNELRKNDKITFTPKQINDMWLNASHLCNDPLFGLHFGESLQLAALGTVGEIIKTSNTIGEAITNAAAFTHLVTDLFRMQVEKSRQTFSIYFIPSVKKSQDFHFSFKQMLDLFMVFTIHELDGLLLQKIKPKAVKFPYRVPDMQEYERVLRCKPAKKDDEYSLTFENSFWNEPITTANYELQNMLLQKANKMRDEQNNLQTLEARIYNYLSANAYLGIISLEEIAANFNTSPRSIQRKLKEEGIKYQQIADRVRKSLALHYLRSDNYQVKEISYMLGYNELSAFSRAFRRWTGTTPVDFQKNGM